MNLTNSLLRDLMLEYPRLRTQIYFKSSLTALARAMQDLVLSNQEPHLVIANFQQERFFRFSANRFSKMAHKNNRVYVLGVPDLNSSFALDNAGYETIPLSPSDTMAGEKCLTIVSREYSACLIMREKLSLPEITDTKYQVDQGQRYEGIWTFDSDVAKSSADWLLGRIQNYRPELKSKTEQARQSFSLRESVAEKTLTTQGVDLGIFTQRLVTYIQAGQYKLIKAYKTIATAERKEQLISQIAAAQRSHLDAAAILDLTIKKLSAQFPDCRCLLYQLQAGESEVTIAHEFAPNSMPSLLGQRWSIVDDPIFLVAQIQNSALAINDVTNNIYLPEHPTLSEKVERGKINAWLMVSIRDRDRLLGILELHYGGSKTYQWQTDDISLVEAIANSTGAALTQASAYNNLLELNTKLAAVERIQTNLIAIVGHELRTPLSTIKVCLESLATEPDMAVPLKDIMLDTALQDMKRMEQLIQSFLTLSKLEAGKAYLNIESLTFDYALNLALRKVQTTAQLKFIPTIKLDLPENLPNILADIDGLIEVLIQLLDNACKFTPQDGKVDIQAKTIQKTAIATAAQPMLEIIVTDTGRGIDAEKLKIIFDPFSQSEDYMRRTVSGVGLGLVICRQIIETMGGKIWAQSDGEDRGCQFHFTVPIEV